MKALTRLWIGAGLDAVEIWELTVPRTFRDFDDFWATSTLGANVRLTVAAMSAGDVALLKARVHARLPAGAAGSISYSARANAIKGFVPSQRSRKMWSAKEKGSA